jgi:hypothetical protein
MSSTVLVIQRGNGTLANGNESGEGDQRNALTEYINNPSCNQ